MKYIRYFEDIGIQDIPLVGGKNASLGEMIRNLSPQGIKIPTGFAITADAYWYYLKENKFLEKIKEKLDLLHDANNIALLQEVGTSIRELIRSGVIPSDLEKEIITAYYNLSQQYGVKDIDVAVRSSATAEDLPTASFAGQQDTFLNIVGAQQLLDACKKSFASLFNDRAIVYRVEQGFDHLKVALSIGVQKMIRSDRGVSGVAFSLDTESGFKDVVMIEASYGLGESIVQGLVTPDQYCIHKPTLQQNYRPIIKKVCGDKKTKIIYAQSGTEVETVEVAQLDQHHFALTDDEILQLARYVMIIESYYSEQRGVLTPMDIEWAKDGQEGTIYIVQARPETIHAIKKNTTIKNYRLRDSDHRNVLVTGLSIGQKIVSGTARIIQKIEDITQVREGDIIVTHMTDPDWVPIMKRAAGIITDWGGRTCHAAIVSRELGIAAIVGTKNGTQIIDDGMIITLDCSSGSMGTVYEGKLEYDSIDVALENIIKPSIPLLVTLADPESAFQTSFLPVDGVGLARVEFIITNVIKIHPLALINYNHIEDNHIRSEIEKITSAYPRKVDFFIEQLACSIGMIAAAFYPKPVIVRLSDFKSNEYRNLIGGSYFEPIEENPMLGLRGASRYYHERYKEAFELECAALKQVRNIMGFLNVKIMVPFVRTIGEAELVIKEMASNKLIRGQDALEFIMMCETPSNVLLIEEFSDYFDGFSIGSNDLTQLILGVDRDSPELASLFDERNDAVKKAMKMAINGAHKKGRYIGICGQAPSDYPEIAQFVIQCGIDSLSLNADVIISFLLKKIV